MNYCFYQNNNIYFNLFVSSIKNMSKYIKTKFQYFRNKKFLPMSYETSMAEAKNNISAIFFIKIILKGSWHLVIFGIISGICCDFTDFAYAPIGKERIFSMRPRHTRSLQMPVGYGIGDGN